MYSFPRLPEQMTMTGQLQPTKIYSAAVLDASSLRSRCQQDHIPRKSGEESFLASSRLLVFSGLWQCHCNLHLSSHDLSFVSLCLSLPWWLSGKESACQCWRCGFNPRVRRIPWRRKWQPTPVFLPWKSHGQRSLMGYSLKGRKESDTT